MVKTTAPDFLQCAAPDCISRARDGHVCTAHYGTLYADSSYAALHFVVIATDPERPHVCQMFKVRAFSADRAKVAARGELAKERRDHWSLACEGRKAAA